MKVREIIFIGLAVIFAYLWWTKKVEPIETTIVETKTIYKNRPEIVLNLQSQPIKLPEIINEPTIIQKGATKIKIPQGAKKYTYKDSIPNGEISSIIYADSIYARLLTYRFNPVEKETFTSKIESKFDNRVMLGGGFDDFYDFNDKNIRLNLFYITNKWMLGVNYGTIGRGLTFAIKL